MVARRLSHSALLSQLRWHTHRGRERTHHDARDRYARTTRTLGDSRHGYGTAAVSYDQLPRPLARRRLAPARHHAYGDDRLALCAFARRALSNRLSTHFL